jgi:hypothetical protein
MAGRRVTALVNEVRPAGPHSADFRAGDFPAGIYVARLLSGSFLQTRKFLLLK